MVHKMLHAGAKYKKGRVAKLPGLSG